jgi:RNA polymerase sigma-70 factor (ECF subfamily)
MLTQAVRRVCPPALANDAEDIVQEATLKILRLQNPSAFTHAYLKRVAHSVIVDELRKRQRRPSIESDVGGDADQVLDTAPADQFTDTGQLIEACLREQLEGRRRAVTLHLLGHTVSEIARLLDCGAKKAENWVYRGMQQLRECLTLKGIRT